MSIKDQFLILFHHRACSSWF